MSEWLRFVDLSPSRKTLRWHVQTIDGTEGLGVVKWIARWRCYGFQPSPGTIFEKDCLRDIAEFCEQKTKTHKVKS